MREKKTEESRHKKRKSINTERDTEDDGTAPRASFVEWQPTPVVAVKATSRYFGGKCVALARENGDLEMYDARTLGV